MTKAKKPVDRSMDPFARSVDLGESTDIEDTKEQDDKKIEDLVPQEASTDEGFQRMLKILGKELPNKENQSQASEGVFSPMSEDVKEEATTSNKEQNIPDTDIHRTQVLPNSKSENVFTKVDNDKNNEQQFSKDDNNDKTNSTDNNNPEKPTFKDEDILPLLDSVITKGYASETYYIRGAKVTLRSQFFWEDQRIVELTDMSSRDITLRATTTFYFQVYALAANLEEFGGNYFKPLNRGTKEELNENFGKRVQFLLGLPSVLVNHLYNLRSEFVQKMSYMTENFDKLLKSF